MEQLTLILVVLFCSFFIGCPVIGALTAKRRQKVNPSDPDPKDLYRARRKLSTVTTFSTANSIGEHVTDGGYRGRPRWLLLLLSPLNFGFFPATRPPAHSRSHHSQQTWKRDTEANAAQLDLGECPICIGPLVPEPVHLEDGLNARGILDQVTTVTRATGTPLTASGPDNQRAPTPTPDFAADDGRGHEAPTATAWPSAVLQMQVLQHRETTSSERDPSQQGCVAAAAAADPHTVDDARVAPNENDKSDKSGNASKTPSWSRYRRQWTDRATARARAGEDDILSLNVCGHSFHAKCLASWFLVERYDCPVCRAVYFVKGRPSLPMRARIAAAPSRLQPLGGDTSDSL